MQFKIARNGLENGRHRGLRTVSFRTPQSNFGRGAQAFVSSRNLRALEILSLGSGILDALDQPSCQGEVSHMKKTERVRQVVSGPLKPEDIQDHAEKGWKLVAVEWEREIEVTGDHLPSDVPFGLRVAPESQQLEENPDEREVLVQMLELIVQEGSYSRVAEEINRRGFRTRQGEKWTSVSVFEMMPRLIEVGPHVFRSPEWQRRKQHFPGPV